jgi:hypothetical protein
MIRFAPWSGDSHFGWTNFWGQPRASLVAWTPFSSPRVRRDVASRSFLTPVVPTTDTEP